MNASRYSEMEMNQWDHACAQPMDCAADAKGASPARNYSAKGQADRAPRHPMHRAATRPAQKRLATSTQTAGTDDWASECLFDCYNG